MFRKLLQSKNSPILQKGIQLIESNQPNEAIIALKEAISKGEQLANSHYHLGLAYYLQKDTVQAVKEWESSVNIEPKSDTLVNLANVYLLKQDNVNIKKAIKFYEQAADISPDDGQIHFNLGVAYEKNGQLDKALSSYREARDYGVEEAGKYFRNVAAKQLKFSE